MSYFFAQRGVFEKHSQSYGSIKQRSYVEKEPFFNQRIRFWTTSQFQKVFDELLTNFSRFLWMKLNRMEIVLLQGRREWQNVIALSCGLRTQFCEIAVHEIEVFVFK